MQQVLARSGFSIVFVDTFLTSSFQREKQNLNGRGVMDSEYPSGGAWLVSFQIGGPLPRHLSFNIILLVGYSILRQAC